MSSETIIQRDRLPPRRAGFAPDAELVARRDTLAELSGADDADRYETIAGLRCAISSPADPRAIIVHCHGGGYRHGTARGWAAFGQRLAAITASRVILADYSLAPEFPFPVAIHEIAEVLDEVFAGRNGLPVLLSGDSAGGGLALAVVALIARPIPLAGMVLLSPWADLRLIADSFKRCAGSDPVFSQDAALEAVEGYLQGVAVDDPLASPLLADLTGLLSGHARIGPDDAAHRPVRRTGCAPPGRNYGLTPRLENVP